MKKVDLKVMKLDEIECSNVFAPDEFGCINE